MDNDRLSQNEVDALLNAMSSERSSAPSDTTDASGISKPLLSQDEIDTLLSGVSSAQTVREGFNLSPTTDEAPSIIVSSRRRDVNVEKYDFTMPSRVSRDQIRSLRGLHDNYARSLSSSLSMTLRGIVEVQCTYIEQLTYGEYLTSLLDPSCIGVFSMKPLKGLGTIEMNPPLAFPIIDRLLGGAGTSGLYNRTLTAIEERIMTEVIEMALKTLQEAWERRSIKLEMKLERVENNPQFARAAAPGDPIILVLFDVRLDEIHSMMSLCLPFMTIQEALAGLSRAELPSLIRSETAEPYGNMIFTHMRDMNVTVSVRYESSSVILRELLELQKGDIIKLQNADKNETLVFIAGQKKFYGKPGMVNKRRAVRIYDVEKESEGHQKRLTFNV